MAPTHPRGASLLLTELLTQACSVHDLAAPPLPDRSPPPTTPTARAPAPGETLVTLDVLGAPARVDRIVGRQTLDTGAWPMQGRGRWQALTPYLQTTPVCRAPCTVPLPQGDLELLFTALDPTSPRASSDVVHIGAEPVVVRHELGSHSDHTGRMLGAVLLGGLAGSGLLTGGALAIISQDRRPGQFDAAPAAWTVAGIGLAAAIAAVWLGIGSAPELQPGATTVFPAAGGQ